MNLEQSYSKWKDKTYKRRVILKREYKKKAQIINE